MKTLYKIADKLYLYIKWIVGIDLAVMTIITFAQVVMRFVFSNPFSWAEEVTELMLQWFGFLAIPLAVYDDSHMCIEFLYEAVPKTGKKIFNIIKYIVMGIFGGAMFYKSFKLLKVNKGTVLPASRLPKVLASSTLTICGIFLIFYCIVLLLKQFYPDTDIRKETAENDN